MMQQDTIYDVLVVGAGLVGASCALALARQGLRVGLLDKRELPRTDGRPDPELDSRVYTITPGNADWLSSLGVWQRLDSQRLAMIDEMEIWGDEDTEAGRSPSLEFTTVGTSFAHLAYVVEEKVLQVALWSALQETDVEVISGEVAGMEIGAKTALLHLLDGTLLHSRLVAAADGGNSAVRTLGGIATRSHAYAQEGVVANFETELPHRNIARQWFMRGGVMAWLPLAGNRVSLVWSTTKASELLNMNAAELAEKVAEAGGRMLGTLRLITPARSFPLALRVADEMAMPRLVLMGDAAHQIHPLAGQGVNLGFRDVITLADTLSSKQRQQDIGSHMLLRRYERARKVDLLEMQLVTHGLNLLFESDQQALHLLRNWGMKALNNQSFLKRQLVRKAV